MFTVCRWACPHCPYQNRMWAAVWLALSCRCPTEPHKVQVVENGVSQRARFSTLLFLFHGTYEEIYLHCRISLCDRSSAICRPVSKLQPPCTGTRLRNSQRLSGRSWKVCRCFICLKESLGAGLIQREVLEVLKGLLLYGWIYVQEVLIFRLYVSWGGSKDTWSHDVMENFVKFLQE